MNVYDRLDQLAIEKALQVAERNASIQCVDVMNFLHAWGWADFQRPDPGPGGALEAAKVGIVDLVSAGTETANPRRMADPPRAGLLFGINGYNVAAGDVKVTFATQFDSGGDVNAQFGAGDFLLLISKKKLGTSTGFAWQLVVSDAPTLSS